MDNDAWKLIHSTGQKAAGDAPFWTTLRSSSCKSYSGARVQRPLVLSRRRKLRRLPRQQGLLGGSLLRHPHGRHDADAQSAGRVRPDGRTLPPNYVRPSILHPPKPRTPSLPPEVNLLGRDLLAPRQTPEGSLHGPARALSSPCPHGTSITRSHRRCPLDQALQAGADRCAETMAEPALVLREYQPRAGKIERLEFDLFLHHHH